MSKKKNYSFDPLDARDTKEEKGPADIRFSAEADEDAYDDDDELEEGEYVYIPDGEEDEDYFSPVAPRMADEPPEETEKTDEASDGPDESYPSYVPGRMEMIFGNSRFLTVMTILNCALDGVWIILYFVTLIARTVMFSNAQAAMQIRGYYDAYTLVFDSPLLGVLKAIVYTVPVFALLWAISVRRADAKDYVLCEKKVMITALCLLLAVAVIAGLDIASMGLVF